MGQKPRPLQPDLSAAHLLGARLREWRVAREISQRTLGQLVHVSGDLICKVEKGERRPHADLVARCDEALGCHGELITLCKSASRDDHGGDAAPRTAERERVLAQLPALRHVLDSYDLPEDGPTLTLSEVRAGVDRLVRLRVSSQYVGLADELPVALSGYLRAYHAAKGDQRAVLAGLLAQAFRAADALADKFALFDLSARIIEIIQRFAAESGDEAILAAAAYVRGEIFFASGEWSMGRRILERASAGIAVGGGSEKAAAYGALHMRAAVLASRAGERGRAHDHIVEAAATAARIEEGIYTGTAFGPASVRIHHVSLAMDSGDPDGALRIAGDWIPPLNVPAERRSHFFVDLASAQALCGRYREATTTLQLARTVAPQHVRFHPIVKATLVSLAEQMPTPTHALRDLSRWAGVGMGVRPSGSTPRPAPSTS